MKDRPVIIVTGASRGVGASVARWLAAVGASVTLVARSEDQLLEVRNFGETTLNEVREKLREHGWRLGMRVTPLPTATF